MLLFDGKCDFRRFWATSPTTNGFPARPATTTAPTGDGVVDLATGRTELPRKLLLAPFGAGADDTTFSLRVTGWRKTVGSATALWVPVTLVELACTLSTAVGVAGADVVATDRFADTITVTKGNANVDTVILSIEGNLVAHAVIDVKGSSKAELTITTGGSATSGNALYATL